MKPLSGSGFVDGSFQATRSEKHNCSVDVLVLRVEESVHFLDFHVPHRAREVVLCGLHWSLLEGVAELE